MTNSSFKTPSPVSSPFIHSGISTAKIFWFKSAALLPLFLVSALHYKISVFILYAAALAGGFMADAAGKMLQGRAISFRDGAAFFTLSLFVLLLPPDTLPWQAALAAFAGMFAARELFGGLGQSLFHPALMAWLFFRVFNAPFEISFMSTGVWGLGAAVLGAAVLIFLKLIRWQASLAYLIVLIPGLILTGAGLQPLLSAEAQFFAFWLLTDSQCAPLVRRSQLVHASFAAVLTVLIFWRCGSLIQAAAFSLLFASAFNPWLDHWVRPARAKK